MAALPSVQLARAWAEEAWHEVTLAGSEWHRSRALRSLARHLSDPELERASDFVGTWEHPEWQASAWAGMALAARDPLRKMFGSLALDSARGVVRLSKRVWLYLLITQAMRPDELVRWSPVGLADLHQVPLEDLAVLLPDVPDLWLPEAAQLASELDPEWLRAETLASLASRMDPEHARHWMEMARAAAEASTDAAGSARAWAALAGSTWAGEGSAILALESLEQIDDPGTRSVVLAELLEWLTVETERRAWEIAAAIRRVELRVPAFARLASRWRGPDAAERVRRSASAWEETTDEWARSSAIQRLWRALPADLRDKAVSIARRFGEDWARAELLSFLAGQVSQGGEELWQEAVVSARAARSPWERARALTAILDNARVELGGRA